MICNSMMLAYKQVAYTVQRGERGKGTPNHGRHLCLSFLFVFVLPFSFYFDFLHFTSVLLCHAFKVRAKG